MNTAAQLLELRKQSHIHNPTAVRNLLGESGYGLALASRWIVPDVETGFLSITGSPSLIEAIELEAKKDPSEKLVAPVAESLSEGVRRTLFAPAVSTAISINEDDSEPGVGDEVSVADGGKSYTAAVSARNPDGTLKLSFKTGEKPSRDTFKRPEVKVLKRAASGAPAPAAASTPATPASAPTATTAAAPTDSRFGTR